MGDLECDHIDSSSGLPYGIRWYRSKRHTKCQVHNQLPGAYNTSIQFRDWAGRYGASWNDSSAMYLMFDGSLGMFEVFPGQWISSYLAIGVRVNATMMVVISLNMKIYKGKGKQINYA